MADPAPTDGPGGALPASSPPSATEAAAATVGGAGGVAGGVAGPVELVTPGEVGYVPALGYSRSCSMLGL